MSGAREAAAAALFARLAARPEFVTVSRRLKHWTDVPPAAQPALFQVQKAELVEQRPGLPPRRLIELDLFLYAHAGDDPASVPAATLNLLQDAVEAALAPDQPTASAQTLGGTVAHVRIEGRIETDEGALGAQAVAIVPIRLLLP